MRIPVHALQHQNVLYLYAFVFHSLSVFVSKTNVLITQWLKASTSVIFKHGYVFCCRFTQYRDSLVFVLAFRSTIIVEYPNPGADSLIRDRVSAQYIQADA